MRGRNIAPICIASASPPDNLSARLPNNPTATAIKITAMNHPAKIHGRESCEIVGSRSGFANVFAVHRTATITSQTNPPSPATNTMNPNVSNEAISNNCDFSRAPSNAGSGETVEIISSPYQSKFALRNFASSAEIAVDALALAALASAF